MTFHFARFIGMFARVAPANAHETEIRFTVNDRQCTLRNVEFDVETNAWTVRLSERE